MWHNIQKVEKVVWYEGSLIPSLAPHFLVLSLEAIHVTSFLCTQRWSMHLEVCMYIYIHISYIHISPHIIIVAHHSVPCFFSLYDLIKYLLQV